MLSPLFESVPPRYYGGTERVIYNLCRGLAAVDPSEVEVVLFSSGDSLISSPSQVFEKVSVVPEALRLKKDPVADACAYNFKMLSTVAKRASEFDIIHNHHDYWMLPLAEMSNTPLLTTLHGRIDLPDSSSAFMSFPHSFYVSISDSQRRPLPQLRWVKTIRHGIDVNDFAFHKKPGKYLAFLGRINIEKRPDWAIEMAYRSGVPLKIAAKIEGKESQDYFDHAIKPHLDGKFIEYVGEISETEKSDFLGNALALAFPIDWPEPFGLVVVEALACGTPVLARPCGSMPELLKDGLTGFSSLDIKSLADRVQDIEKLDRTQCRRWVEKKFSLQRMTEEYIDVYRHVAAQRIKSDRNRWNFLYPVQRVADGNS
jgi:glycosyltransferase involved in cell wall biosynthesis